MLPGPLTARRRSQTLRSPRGFSSGSLVSRPSSATLFISSFLLAPVGLVFACEATKPRKGEARTEGEGSEATLRASPDGAKWSAAANAPTGAEGKAG